MTTSLVVNVLVAVGGSILGATFADIDLAPPLPIRHRSFWTHGPLIPWALVLATPYHPLVWWFALGFLPAYAIHLLKDMFPQRWHGGALIKLFPLPGTLPALLSFLWLAGGVGYSCWLTWGMVWQL